MLFNSPEKHKCSQCGEEYKWYCVIPDPPSHPQVYCLPKDEDSILEGKLAVGINWNNIPQEGINIDVKIKCKKCGKIDTETLFIKY